jgi:hypothetical protein
MLSSRITSYKIVAYVFVIASLFLTRTLFAQPAGGVYITDLAEERRKLAVAIASIRKLIQDNGDAGLKNADSQISFSVSDEPILNAWFFLKPDGKPTIQITSSYRLAMTYLADADMVNRQDIKFSSCFGDYVSSLYSTLGTNRKKSEANQTQQRLAAPEDYLLTASAPCRSYAGKFPIDPTLRRLRDMIVNDMIALVYLHELGHFAQGHVGVHIDELGLIPDQKGKLSKFLQLQERSRAQEASADDWAIDRWVDISTNPMAIFNPSFANFYLAMGGYGCDQASTHPNGFFRFARQMSRLRDRSIEKGKAKKNEIVDRLIDDHSILASTIPLRLSCYWDGVIR